MGVDKAQSRPRAGLRTDHVGPTNSYILESSCSGAAWTSGTPYMWGAGGPTGLRVRGRSAQLSAQSQGAAEGLLGTREAEEGGRESEGSGRGKGDGRRKAGPQGGQGCSIGCESGGESCATTGRTRRKQTQEKEKSQEVGQE